MFAVKVVLSNGSEINLVDVERSERCKESGAFVCHCQDGETWTFFPEFIVAVCTRPAEKEDEE